MNKFVLLTVLIGLVPFAWTEQTTQKKSSAKKSSAKRRPAASKSAAAKKSGASKSGASKSGAGRSTSPSKSTKSGKRGGKKTARRSGPPAQQAPTTERYRQIEQSLAERGYLKSQPTGQWGTEAQEAFKKFQQDQNLNPTGKIDSLSLIALGLGPKRGTPPPKAQP